MSEILIPYYNSEPRDYLHALFFFYLPRLLFRRQERERLVPNILGSSVDHVSVARDHAVEVPSIDDSHISSHGTV